jgi:Uma2 family endonuclease
MIYLIDGHNVIGQLPDISLDDPNDEAMLVQKLVSFTARTKRRCVVVFDHGLPGGTSRMSTRDVQVVFASQRSNADRVMIERIGKIPDPVQWIVVSSDNDVLGAARGRKMQTLRSDAFAILLESPPAPDIDAGEAPNVELSAAEVDEWLQIFGNENGQAGSPQSSPNNAQKGKKDTPPLPTKSGKSGLSQRDMADWTRFVNEEINPRKSGKHSKSKHADPKQPKQTAPPKIEAPQQPVMPSSALTTKADLIGGEQGEIAGKIFLRIGLHVEERALGRLTTAGTGYIVANTLLDPDVGFVAIARAPKGLPKGHVPFAPDLAVEIVSPDEKPRQVLDRIERYLENGTRLVWVIYPDERIVDVWRRSDRGGLNKQKVGIDGTLDGEDVLPGFKLAVRGIFPK